MKSKKRTIGIMTLVLGIIGLITWQLSSSIFYSANTRKQEPQTSASSADAGPAVNNNSEKVVADNLSYWNAKDYQEYVEEQNQFLDKLADSGEKYQENGEWYVWTKKKVDEAKQLNLDMLQQVKDGYLLEKTPEDAETQLIIYP